MPRHCSAGGCKSRDNRETRKAGITFHKLPKGTTRRNLWITNSHRTDLWDPQTDFVYFCSKHFTPESFELTGCSGIRRLREDAFPTIFESSPEAKRKGPWRPRKRENIHVRKNPHSLKPEPGDQESMQEETEEAQNKDGEKVQKSVPPYRGKCDPDVETNVNILASSQVTSEAEKLSQQECCPSPPPVSRPLSPSRYMRRLPPPPGFYLPKEHSYAQLCPLLWRRRYDQAIDCLEKALRQLHAARRRENRLRSTLLRLREKRLKHTLLISRDGSKSRGGWLPAVENRQCRGGGDTAARGSCLANQEESEIDVKSEDMGLFEDRSGEQMDWGGHFLTTDTNNWPEEEGGYCFYCGRGREHNGGREAHRVSKTRKDGQPIVRDGSLGSHVNERGEECGKLQQLLKRCKGQKKVPMASEAGASQESGDNYHDSCGMAESAADRQIVGKDIETTLNLHSGSNLPIPQVLLQTQGQGGLQQMTPAGLSLHDTLVQCLHSGQGSRQELLLSGLCAGEAEHTGEEHHEELQQQLFWIQDSAEGQVLLLPVPSEDGLKSVVRMEGVDEDAQTILVSEVGLKRDFGHMTEDNGDKCLENLSRELRVEMASDNGHGEQHSNINSTPIGIREDMREKLKEHLEGFHLQLSSEFIN
ncbi:THAP domain-containing protein 7 [Centroberyx gerrardi]|uniref:THAP domain-containing protein 7 n=1 Tax=Centroberyx gerrardi TaxID=166262 RepID=UPI003AB07BC2